MIRYTSVWKSFKNIPWNVKTWKLIYQLSVMIELTPTASLYPLWEPAWPTIFWWWSIVSLFIIAALWWRRWLTRKKNLLIVEQATKEVPVMSKEIRLQQLLEINTSVRTPEQKAKALLAHLFFFIWEEYDKHSMQQYTLEEIKYMSWAEFLFPAFASLYTVLYTDEKITHHLINEITKSIHSLIAWT